MSEERPLIIAVDFDGTLVEDKFPLIGEIRYPVWRTIQIAKNSGCKVILWTCRNKEYLDEAVAFCKDNGLEFDAVNENLPEIKEVYGGDTRKIFANVYIDDRNGTYDIWAGSSVYFPVVYSEPERVKG